MVKNIMGAVIAAAVAISAGTTGVKSNTTYKNATQIVKSAKTTTLSDYHSNVEFRKSSDIQKISKSYGLKDSKKIDKIIYIPVNDYSVNDASGQNEEVSVNTRLASYSVKKKGYKDQVSFMNSKKAVSDSSLALNESVHTTFDFSNIKSVSGQKAALKSCLSSAYGFSVSKKSNVNNTFKTSLPDHAAMNLYVVDRSYDYQLWENDLAHDVPSDSYLGSGTVTRPIGVIVTVNENL